MGTPNEVMKSCRNCNYWELPRDHTPCSHCYNYNKWKSPVEPSVSTSEVKMCSTCAKGADLKLCSECVWEPVNVTLQETVEAILTPICDKVDELQAIQDGAQSHYSRFPIQPREFCHVNNLGGVEYNVIKYICRYPYKENPLKDLFKARESIDYLIKKEQEKGNAQAR